MMKLNVPMLVSLAASVSAAPVVVTEPMLE
jgi:hypothetical protein